MGINPFDEHDEDADYYEHYKLVRDKVGELVVRYFNPSDSKREPMIATAMLIYRRMIELPETISLKTVRLDIQKLQSRTKSLGETFAALSDDALMAIIVPVKGSEDLREVIADVWDHCDQIQAGCQAILDSLPVSEGGAPGNLHKQICAILTVQFFQQYRPTAVKGSNEELRGFAEEIYDMFGPGDDNVMARAIPDAIKRLSDIQKNSIISMTT